MKIQDAFIGAISTLLVTVVGGVIVYYATKEPDDKKGEKLIYSLNETATFTGGAQQIAFSTLTVTNEGGVAARNPTLTIALDSAEVRDLSVSAHSGTRELSRETTPKKIRLTFESLLPQETISLSILLSRPERPTINVRSEASLAEERIASSRTDKEIKSERLNTVAKIAVPVASALSLVVWVWLTIRVRRRGVFDLFADKNNAGFLLLHHGLVDDAGHILGAAVREGRSDPYVLSNYALFRALGGHFDEAESFLRAAKFRDRAGHAMAVVLFNEALIRLKQGDESASITKLAEAARLSRTEIKRYAEKSVHFDSVRERPGFIAAIGGAQG